MQNFRPIIGFVRMVVPDLSQPEPALPVAASLENGGRLYAYEKALIAGSIADFMRENPIHADRSPLAERPLGLCRGNLFRNLRPFVLR